MGIHTSTYRVARAHDDIILISSFPTKPISFAHSTLLSLLIKLLSFILGNT